MKTKFMALAALTVFAIASAQANTWTLHGITFTDGATASGFIYVDLSGQF